MKKITRAILVAAGLGASAAVSAAPALFTSGMEITSGSTGLCALLGESVTMTLSKNVYGAYDCDTTNTDIRIATCHAAGSNKTTTMDCAVVGFMTDGTTPVNNDGSTGTACASTWQIANYRIFGGSSRGGTVAPLQNTDSCLNAKPDTHGYFNNR